MIDSSITPDELVLSIRSACEAIQAGDSTLARRRLTTLQDAGFNLSLGSDLEIEVDE